jgi:hypothetical protein
MSRVSKSIAEGIVRPPRIGCGSLRVASAWCERTSMISPSRLIFLDWRLSRATSMAMESTER